MKIQIGGGGGGGEGGRGRVEEVLPVQFILASCVIFYNESAEYYSYLYRKGAYSSVLWVYL